MMGPILTMLNLAEASDMIHSQFGGSGLGLYICKSMSSPPWPSLIPAEITELLDGRIEVLSELGNGSGEYPATV